MAISTNDSHAKGCLRDSRAHTLVAKHWQCQSGTSTSATTQANGNDNEGEGRDDNLNDGNSGRMAKMTT